MGDFWKYWLAPIGGVHYRGFRYIGEKLSSTFALITFLDLARCIAPPASRLLCLVYSEH